MSDIIERETKSTPAEIRDNIMRLEAEMRGMEQVEIPVRHLFAEGLYIREITIPAGATAVGYIHKQEHVRFILKGDVTITTEFGTERIKAPHTWIAKPGVKAAAYAHEETIWTTVHAATERDVATLEAKLVTNSYDDPALQHYAQDKLES